MTSIYDHVDLGDEAPAPVEVESSHERKPLARVVVAYGTRPEKIKLAPLVEALRARGVQVTEWNSGQQRDLLERQDDDLCENWSGGVTEGIARTMSEFRMLLAELTPPDAVIVQGDTATAFACAQAAFLARVPIAHVEAGMRTYASEPWPEEAFRRQIAAVAKWHFAPDEDAAQNLCRELGLGYRDMPTPLNVYVTGNTVIDTLPREPFRVLVTLHRRENWGERIQNALNTLFDFSQQHSNVEVRVIEHPNWQRQGLTLPPSKVMDLRGVSWKLYDPMPRGEMLERMQVNDLIVTDSGGLQEEAAHFGVPVLVLRTATERVALERAGAVVLVDPDDPSELRSALERQLAKRRCYGSGDASTRIADILVRELANAKA